MIFIPIKAIIICS